MKKLIYLITFLYPVILYGQDPNIVIKDFNDDQFPDTLISYYSGGSGFGGTYVTLIIAKTNERFELNNFSCFCDIRSIVLIPPELLKNENYQFLEAVNGALLPGKYSAPDASLQWLIAANLNRKELPDNIYYDQIIYSPTKWIKGDIKLPKTYYVDVASDTLHWLLYTDFEKPVWYDSLNNMGYLIYSGLNHYGRGLRDSLLMLDSTSAYQAYKTSHAVVLKKADSYAWLFISDYRLTGAPEKLRWESIGEVKIIDKYLIIHLINSMAFSNPIYIIDIEKGVSARLKSGNDYYRHIKIEEGDIIIDDDTEIVSFKLENLFEELDKNSPDTR